MKYSFENWNVNIVHGKSAQWKRYQKYQTQTKIDATLKKKERMKEEKQSTPREKKEKKRRIIDIKQ